MAFRSEETAGCVSRARARAGLEPRIAPVFPLVLIALLPAVISAAEYNVRHDHIRGGCAGTLTIDEGGVTYHESEGHKREHPHDWTWNYLDIQQLESRRRGSASSRILVVDGNWVKTVRTASAHRAVLISLVPMLC